MVVSFFIIWYLLPHSLLCGNLHLLFPEQQQALIYKNTVKPCFYGIFISDRLIVVQCLADSILDNIHGVLLVMDITVGQPVKFLLVADDIVHNSVI